MSAFAIYCRVSTARQGASGLGLEAQKQMCLQYISQQNGILLSEFMDIESGKSRTRTGLWNALNFCKANSCTLVIAKLDRLARDVEFTFKVINSGVQIHFCDMPAVNTMILGVFASVAQYERELISSRTKSALQAKKMRGEEWQRNSDTSNATLASAESRTNKAKENKHNLFLLAYLGDWERDNGQINSAEKGKIAELCAKLNRLGATTATGLAFNPTRLLAMATKIKKLYNQI